MIEDICTKLFSEIITNYENAYEEEKGKIRKEWELIRDACIISLSQDSNEIEYDSFPALDEWQFAETLFVCCLNRTCEKTWDYMIHKDKAQCLSAKEQIARDIQQSEEARMNDTFICGAPRSDGHLEFFCK